MIICILKIWDRFFFSEIRVSTVGSNGGGEGAEEEQRRWGEDDAKTPGERRYLEVRGLRRERNNSFLNIGPGAPIISVANGRPRAPAKNIMSRQGPRVRRFDPGVLLETVRTC